MDKFKEGMQEIDRVAREAVNVARGKLEILEGEHGIKLDIVAGNDGKPESSPKLEAAILAFQAAKTALHEFDETWGVKLVVDTDTNGWPLEPKTIIRDVESDIPF